MGSGAKSYMRKDFLIYEEMHIYFTIHMTLHLIPKNFLIYEENFISFVLSVQCYHQTERIFIIYLDRELIFKIADIKAARQANKKVPPDNSYGLPSFSMDRLFGM
jgi:hypothetical protein